MLYFSQKIRKGNETMYTVTYYQNYERKVTTWDTYERANAYAIYLSSRYDVYGVKIEEAK